MKVFNLFDELFREGAEREERPQNSMVLKSCVSEIRRQEEVRWKVRRRRAESLGHRRSRWAGRYARRRRECRPA